MTNYVLKSVQTFIPIGQPVVKEESGGLSLLRQQGVAKLDNGHVILAEQLTHLERHAGAVSEGQSFFKSTNMLRVGGDAVVLAQKGLAERSEVGNDWTSTAGVVRGLPKQEVGVGLDADASSVAGKLSNQVAPLLNAGEPVEALNHARAACELEPGNRIHENRRGMAEKRLGNEQAALEAFQLASRLSVENTGKDFGPARYNLAAIAASRGDVVGALTHLAIADKSVPEGKPADFFHQLVGEGKDAKRDRDFDSIRDTQEFQAFMARG